MHEASLMRDLMRQLLSAAEGQGAARVVGITVRLGALSHMSPEHFREHFDAAARGTLAEGAAVVAIEVPDIQDPHAADVVLESFEIE